MYNLYWSHDLLKVFFFILNIQKLLIIRKNDGIFFLNFQTYQEKFLKIFNIANFFNLCQILHSRKGICGIV